MLDYYMVDAETGRRTLVAQISDADLNELLRDGFDLTDETGPETASRVRERLEIELVRRQAGLK